MRDRGKRTVASALVLVVLLAVTGSLLMFADTPVPGEAYASLERLEQDVLFGAFARSIHHWSANTVANLARSR